MTINLSLQALSSNIYPNTLIQPLIKDKYSMIKQTHFEIRHFSFKYHACRLQS